MLLLSAINWIQTGKLFPASLFKILFNSERALHFKEGKKNSYFKLHGTTGTLMAEKVSSFFGTTVILPLEDFGDIIV